MSTQCKSMMLAVLVSGVVLPVQAAFQVVDLEGRLEIQDDGKTVFGWQHQPLTEPKGGAMFAASAFIHPLCTPSGFGLTQIQPDDHLHHFGLWWPWKMLTVDGKDYNTWEIQEKQGRQVAVKIEVASATADEVKLNLHNRFEISRDGSIYQPVINEKVLLRFARNGKDGYVLDLDITQQPVEGVVVAVKKYRYSGFSWRGTSAWQVDNSVMRTSGGHHRDNANHQPATWLGVEGATPQGRATMLILSAVASDAGKPELLRVWGSDTMHGAPFANFNPVVKESLALDGMQQAVSRRRYRVVIADRAILPAESDKLWNEWQGKDIGD